jgi:hypothetical protein
MHKRKTWPALMAGFLLTVFAIQPNPAGAAPAAGAAVAAAGTAR